MLATGILVLAGTAILMSAGAGTAYAQPISTNVCHQIGAAFDHLNATFNADIKTMGLQGAAALAEKELTQAASPGSPAVRSAMAVYVADLKKRAAGVHLDTAELLAAGNAVVLAACTPSGAPATGGGSTAGLQDPALFGLGGAVLLAGVVVLRLAARNRPRVSAGRG
jgi:hypothetical protein